MSDADKMREKQRRADLKAQGIDPDAEDKTKAGAKEYDQKFLDQYKFEYGIEQGETEEPNTAAIEESKEEEIPEPKVNQKKK